MADPDFVPLLTRALTPDAEPAEHTSVDDRILDAALELVGAYGLRRTSMEQIAERAGVARRTVYRRFGSKETVAERLAARELQRFLATVRKTINAAPDPGTSAVEAFVAVMRFAASHPLIDRLARIEPNVLLETMRAGDPSPMEIAGAFVADRIRSGQRKGKVPVRDADELADVLVHLALSYILLPSQVVDLSDDDRLRAFAHSAIAPILSPPEAAGTRRP